MNRPIREAREWGAPTRTRGQTLWYSRARICKPFKEPRNRFPAWRADTTTLLSYRPVRPHRLAESIPRNRFLSSLNVYKYVLRYLWTLWLSHSVSGAFSPVPLFKTWLMANYRTTEILDNYCKVLPNTLVRIHQYMYHIYQSPPPFTVKSFMRAQATHLLYGCCINM